VIGYHLDPMLGPTLGSAAFIGAIALYLWRRRADTKGAFTLALVAGLLVAWCLTGAAESAATDLATQRTWFILRDSLTLPGVILAFWFALQYAGLERWLTRPVAVVLVAATIVHISLEVVDGGRLLWSSIQWDREIQGDRTELGLVFAAIAIAMFLLSTAVFLVLFVRSPAHRLPVALILFGQLGLRVLYPIVVFNVVYVPNIVAGVLGFDLVAAMYAVALFRFRMFDLVPVARGSIFATMPEALLVLDPADRIADANETALRWFKTGRRDLVGRPVAAALAPWQDLVRAIGELGQGPSEASFGEDGTSACEISTTPLSDWQARPIGRLVLLHDITALRQVELQLVDRERALAAAQERERLARELHDGLAQDLWLAKLKATRLASQPELGPESRILTDEVTAAVDAGLAEAHEAVAAMRLVGDEGTPVGELLSQVLEDFEERFGLAVEFDCEAKLPTLPARTEAELLRIVQEALTNVRRHADATVVRVRAAVEARQLILEVRDNGRGFSLESVGESPYGLAGMRERAGLIGGQIEIESAPRKGTRVRLAVPVQNAAAVEVTG
jgi:signal transduction histidine kinase